MPANALGWKARLRRLSNGPGHKAGDLLEGGEREGEDRQKDETLRPGRPADGSLSKELLGGPGDGGGARPAKS